jgi:hypothetical protein
MFVEQGRLTFDLLADLWIAHVWNPVLNRAQSGSALARAIGSHALSGSRSLSRLGLGRHRSVSCRNL